MYKVNFYYIIRPIVRAGRFAFQSIFAVYLNLQ